MTIIVLFGVFLISNVAIVIGYYNPIFGFGVEAFSQVYKELPLILCSFLLTALIPLNLLIAFFTSRGNYEVYKNELFALSLVTPYLVIFAMLPGKLDAPVPLHFNLTPLVVIVVVSHLFGTHLLAKRAWSYGGRDAST